MLAITQSAVLAGITSHPVRVEVQAARGIPTFELVGYAEATVRESRVRVKSALAGVGIDIGEYRVTINLAPADLKKSGSAFDLAIAVGTLVALGAIEQKLVDDVLFLGELSLNGEIQSLRGVIAHLLGAKARGVARAIVPVSNEQEASLIDGMEVTLATNLRELIESMRGTGGLRAPIARTVRARRVPSEDLADVRGQSFARRALEVAAAGGHNLLMIGPPGSGKTMLARRLPGILPLLSREESLEVLAIHGVAGLHGSRIDVERPFRAPHHTVSEVALVGGGETARPGEVSLAHHGVLFLDELTELRRSALEALRQPLEDGVVTVCRMKRSASFPARPMVVAAMNPCPCGRYGDGTAACTCGLQRVTDYQRKISGPLIDRLDVHVRLSRVPVRELVSEKPNDPSLIVRRRVEEAREIQRARFLAGEVSALTNAHLQQRDLERVCKLDSEGRRRLEDAVDQLGLSARVYSKILRVARTIADLEGKTAISPDHISEAVCARLLDRDPSQRRGAHRFDAA